MFNNIEEIKKFLISEYGYLLPTLEDINTFEKGQLKIEEIKVSNNDLLTSLIDKEELSHYDVVDMPIIVRKNYSGYLLVDGYHRLARAIQTGHDSMFAFILS